MPDPCDEIDIWQKCPNCPFRIGTHSIFESVQCGIMTKEEANYARPSNCSCFHLVCRCC